MYQKSSGLTKFIILFFDCISIVISLLLTDYAYHTFYKRNSGVADYTILLMIVLGIHMVAFLFVRAYVNFYVRGKLIELWECIKANIFIVLGATLVLFFLKLEDYSRMVLLLFAICDCMLMMIFHQILKKLLPYMYGMMITKRKTIVVGTSEFIQDIINEIDITKDYSTELVGISYTDEGRVDTDIYVIDNIEEVMDFCRKESVDEAVIEINSSTRKKLMPVMDELGSAGIIIKYRQKVPVLDSVDCQAVNIAGEHLVVTYATRSVSTGKLLIKRGFDIFAGLCGSVVAILLLLIVGPMIRIESKGPILFSQKRVGRNGRIFTIYKFRSMYLDAEERKAELMKHNQMDGLVFKMDNDPRITKVGKFIRKTSIDEFPQFFNVLNGDMSMVGTRPPTLDEFEKYNLSQKGRLSFRPGLTGLWQVSGRNSIKDFEDIVALDKKYIREWSPLLDIKIILKTVPAMLSGK